MKFKTFCTCLTLVLYSGTAMAGGMISKKKNISKKAKYETLLDEVSAKESDASSKMPKEKSAISANKTSGKKKKYSENETHSTYVQTNSEFEDSVNNSHPTAFNSIPEEDPSAYGSKLTEKSRSSSNISDTEDSYSLSDIQTEPTSYEEQIQKLTGLRLDIPPKNKVKFISEILNVPEIILTTGVNKNDDRVYLMYQPYDTKRKMKNTALVEKANAKWKKYIDQLKGIIPHTEYNAIKIYKDDLVKIMNNTDEYKFDSSEQARSLRRQKALELLRK